MTDLKIGTILKNARLEKNLSIEELAKESNLSCEDIEKIENNQLNLFSKDKRLYVIVQYSWYVGVDIVPVLKEIVSLQQSDTTKENKASTISSVERKAVLDKVNSVMGNPSQSSETQSPAHFPDPSTFHFSTEEIDDIKAFEMPAAQTFNVNVAPAFDKKETEHSNSFSLNNRIKIDTSSEQIPPVESVVSEQQQIVSHEQKTNTDEAYSDHETTQSRYARTNAYSTSEKQKSKKPLVLLTLLAIIIILIAVILVWFKNPFKSQNQTSTSSSYTVQKSSVSSSKTSDSSENTTTSSTQSPTFKTTIEGSQLNVTVSNAKTPLKLEISVSDGNRSWISISNTENGDESLTLGDTQNTYTTTLSSNAINSLITFGATQGVSVKINDKTLDLTDFLQNNLSSIYLTIEK